MSSLRSQFLAHLAQTSEIPMAIEVTRAEGVYLYDNSDRAYMDLISGISVSNLGHQHPAIVTAIQQQAAQYLHTLVYGEYILSPQVEFATLLASKLPDPIDKVYFVSTGSEATEGAMKLAKRYTHRQRILACKYAYHGSTQGAMSLMWPDTFTRAYQPLLPEVDHILFNDVEDLQKIDETVAAVILEPIQAEAGVILPNQQYMADLRQRCTDTGTLLIFDEIQTAFGRTGHLFALEGLGVTPDIILLAKALGGGMPLGAFAASGTIMAALTHDPPLGHITTFGGHPVSCAAGLAALRQILTSSLINDVPQKSARIIQRLKSHQLVKEIRAAGLLMAIDVGSFERMIAIVRHGIRLGIIVDWFLFNEQSLRLAPPLIISMEEIDKACDLLLEAMDHVLQETSSD